MNCSEELMFPKCSLFGLETSLSSLKHLYLMAPPVGIEPTTCGLGNRRSIH